MIRLLVIGNGNIGKRVVQYLQPFMNVTSFDILENDESELQELSMTADCITLHIPKMDKNESFISKNKLSIMKDNTTIINTTTTGQELIDLQQALKSDAITQAEYDELKLKIIERLDVPVDSTDTN